MQVLYSSCKAYIESRTTLRDRIKALDALIDAMLLTSAGSAGKANLTQFSLNDGQTIVNTTYRSMKDLVEDMKALETLKQMYVNRLMGRGTRMVDSKNFPGYGF